MKTIGGTTPRCRRRRKGLDWAASVPRSQIVIRSRGIQRLAHLGRLGASPARDALVQLVA